MDLFRERTFGKAAAIEDSVDVGHVAMYEFGEVPSRRVVRIPNDIRRHAVAGGVSVG